MSALIVPECRLSSTLSDASILELAELGFDLLAEDGSRNRQVVLAQLTQHQAGTRHVTRIDGPCNYIRSLEIAGHRSNLYLERYRFAGGNAAAQEFEASPAKRLRWCP